MEMEIGKDMRDFSGVMELFYILIGVSVTQIYAFVKT